MREKTTYFFGRRAPRMRKKHELLLEKLPQYSRALDNLSSLFLQNPKMRFMLEIGFGDGWHFEDYANKNPDTLCLGIEPYVKGVCALLERMENKPLPNVLLWQECAQEFVPCIPSQSMDEIMVFFPDPWPKKRYHKRRVIQEDFLRTCHRILKHTGKLLITTDDASYQLWIQGLLDQSSYFDVKTSEYYPNTRYAQKGFIKGNTPVTFIATPRS